MNGGIKTRMTGIYKIQSKIKPERIYIGSSVDMSHRWVQHKNCIPSKSSHHPKLACHVRKYGIDDLEFSIIEQFEFLSKEHLLEREQYYIDILKPWFNTCSKAGSVLGRKCSEKTKEKIRESRKGSHASEETRVKMSMAGRGRRHSEEARAKMSGSAMGNKNASGCIRSEAWGRLVSERNKRLGLIPPSRLGVKYTEAQKCIIMEKRAATKLLKKQKSNSE